MNTFIISYSPMDGINFDDEIRFFNNDIFVFGHDFIEALEHLHHPGRCPDCMSKDLDFSEPLMPACRICGFTGTLNKFEPAVNVQTQVVLEEPVWPGDERLFMFGNISEARREFEKMYTEMKSEMEYIFDNIAEKQSFWGSIFKSEGPKGELLCLIH